MQAGDKLTLDFDDDRTLVCDITSVEPSSYWFRTGALESPTAKMRIHSDADMNGELPSEEVELRGSCALPGGGLFMPGRLRTENYLEFYHGQNVRGTHAAIKYFRLQRPDKDGELQDVRMNQAPRHEASESYNAVVESFTAMEQQLLKSGYDFNEPGMDVHGSPMRFNPTTQTTHVSTYPTYAQPDSARQIYAYTAANQTAHAMSYTPSSGVVQVATLQNVSPDMFTKEVDTGWGPSNGLWYVSSTNLARLSKLTPAITYTWQNPSVDIPVMEVSFASNIAGSELDEARLRAGEEPAYESVDYQAQLRITDSQVDARFKPTYWLRKHPEVYEQVAEENTQAQLSGDGIDFRFGKVELHIQATAADDLAEMVAAVHEVTALSNAPEKRSKWRGILRSLGFAGRPQ